MSYLCPQVLTGLIYKIGDSFNVYRPDYPNYRIKEKMENFNSCLYTVKTAPIPILSTEFNYLTERTVSDTIANTSEPISYTRAIGTNKQFDAVFKTSLSEKLSIDSRYTYQKIDQGSAEGLSNAVNTKSHTASLKGTWNLSDSFSYSISGAYSQTTDYLLSQEAYSLSPGFGFILKQGDKLRVDFDYSYTKSYSAVGSERINYSLKTKYSVSNFVNVIIQATREIGISPDYRLSEITGNIEINL